MTYIDLKKRVFGDYIVIERDYNYGKEKHLAEWNKKTFWKCECLKCHSIIIRQGNVLRNKNTKNECRICKQKEKERVKEEEKAKRRKPNSNPRLKNLVGEQFGFLKVLKLDEEKSKPGQIYWQVNMTENNTLSLPHFLVEKKNMKKEKSLIMKRIIGL